MELRRVHKDERGEIYVIEGLLSGDREVTMFTTKQEHARGGCVHRDNDEFFMVLSGRVSYKIDNEENKIVEAGEIIKILADRPHYFKALIDTVAVEWGATVKEKKEYDPLFRGFVNEINRKANSATFDKYAKYYDIIYSGKDYDAEVAYLVELFERFGQPRRVLDLGCGTGEHMIRLQRLGYSVTGLDLSEAMIARARGKGLFSTWNADMRDFDVDSRFDACICMFGGIGYLEDIQDLVRTLECLKAHLELDGLFIFDYWNGLAVLRERPEITVRTVSAGELEILRIARPKMNPVNQTCEVNYTCLVKRGDRYIEEFEETHSIRFYFPSEIRLALSTAGFEHLATYPLMKCGGEPNEKSWSVTTIARKSGI